MARTGEQILKQILGEKDFQIAMLMAQIEELKEQLPKPVEPPKVPDAPR